MPIAEKPQPGAALGHVGGQPDPNLAVVAEPGSQQVAITGSGFGLAIAGSDEQGRPQDLGESGALRVPVSGALQLQGEGFAQDDVVQVYLDPTIAASGLTARSEAGSASFLGAISTDSQGRIESAVTLPAGVAPGDRVLQLVGTTSAGATVVLTVGITIEPAATPEPTIVITGTRGQGRDAGRIQILGVTTGLVGSVVVPWIKVPGQKAYSQGAARPLVGADGTFTWRRSTGKKTYIYFTSAKGSRSKAIAVEARQR